VRYIWETNFVAEDLAISLHIVFQVMEELIARFRDLQAKYSTQLTRLFGRPLV